MCVCAYVCGARTSNEPINQSINHIPNSHKYRSIYQIYRKHKDKQKPTLSYLSLSLIPAAFNTQNDDCISSLFGSHAFSCNCIGSAVPVRSTSLVQPALKRPEPRSLATSTKGIMVYHRSLRQEKEDLY